MSEPKPWADLVEAFRAEATPTTDAIDRGWQEVQSGIATGTPPPLEHAPTVGIGLKVALSALLVGGAATALVLAGRSQPGPIAERTIAAADAHEASEPPPAPPSASRPVSAPASRPDSAPASSPTPSVQSPISDVDPAATPEAAPEVETKATRRRTGARTPKASTPTDDAASLAAELALLREARAALRAGKAERALALVATHRDRHPGSTFDEERRLTAITALCALGRTGAAQLEADAFSRRFPASSRGSEAMAGCREHAPAKTSD